MSNITVEELLKAAELLFKDKEYNKLIMLLSDEVLDKYNDAKLYTWRAWAHDKLKQESEALKFANKAISIDDKYGTAYRVRGNAETFYENTQSAIKDYSQAIKLNPNDAIAYSNRGAVYCKIGKIIEAINDIDKSIRMDPNTWQAYSSRGNCHEAQGRLDLAMMDYNQALKLEPNNAVVYTNIGVLYYKLGNLETALINFNRAIEIDPELADSYNNRGNVYHRTGEFEKAIADYSMSIKLNPNRAMAYLNRGNSYAFLAQYVYALKDYEKTIELNNGIIQAYINKGNVCSSMGRYDEALEEYGKALTIDKKNSLALNNRGILYKKIGKVDDAIKEFRLAIEANPNDDLPHKSIGDVLFESSKYPEALHEYELALKINPNNIAYKNARDQARAMLGEIVQTDLSNANGQNINNTAVYVESLISPITNEENKKKIRIICGEIDELIAKVRKLLLYTKEGNIVHYTRIKTADLLAMNTEFKLRYSNVVFMNDPDEGKAFLNYLNEGTIEDAIEEGRKKDDNNIYLGSFLPENKQDYLIMWRTYGKNENNEEATGCSFVIKRNFFDSEDSGSMYAVIDEQKSPGVDNLNNQVLYKVIYYDKASRQFVTDDEVSLEEINNELNTYREKVIGLVNMKLENEEKRNQIIDKLIYRFISELRYFFKSSEYQFEKELRVIKYYPVENSRVKTDKNGSEIPRKLFIESSRFLQPDISKIILGPKVIHPERFLYIEAEFKKQKIEIKLEISKHNFQ